MKPERLWSNRRTGHRPVARQSHIRATVEQLEGRLVPTTLPSGFTESLIASGIAEPTAMEIAPDGRIFVAQQGGALRVIENGNLLPTPFVTLNVDSFFERGLLGVTFDPNFVTNQFVFVYYTTASQPIHNRVSRFTANGNVAVPGSELVLLDLENLDAGNHNGGAIHFGNDGKLYVGVGDNAVPSNAQSLNNRLGKMLRINSDGSIPTDNPFFNQASGANRAIWARGLRNPFTFAVQPGSARIFINDVGQNAREEIDDGIAGANYGWPTCEGACSPANANFRDPLYQYNHGSSSTEGCAITGGAFYNPTTAQFPNDFVGDYFFADFCGNWIRRFDPATNTAMGFATDLPDAPVDLKVDAAGNLYYLTRGFGSATGQLTRVQFPAAQSAPRITQHPADQRVAVGQMATFSVSASGSAPLSFQWQRDGVDIQGANGPSFTINSAALADGGARFRAVVTNAQGSATSNEASLAVVNNQSPTSVITSPGDGTRYNAGDSINFAGTGTDAEDGNLNASAFTWQVMFHHAGHTHPFLSSFHGVTSGSFVIPTVGETSADVFYRIQLTVTDSLGFTHSTTRDVLPNTSTMTLETSPPGLQVRLDGQPVLDGTPISGVVAMRRTLGVVEPQYFGVASPVISSAQWLEFHSWSDGGASEHEIDTPAEDATFRAVFRAVPYPEIDDLQLNAEGRRLTEITIHFNRSLDAAAAMDSRNFRVVSPGRDKRFNTAAARSSDDVVIPFDAPQYGEPSGQGGGDGLVRLSLRRAVPFGTFVQVSVDGTKRDAMDHAISSVAGFVLDGEYRDVGLSGDGIEGGDFVALIGVGTKFFYRDGDGDQVTLGLTGGLMQLTRTAPVIDGKRAEGISLIGRTTGTTGELFGHVKRRSGDGRTTLASLWITGSAFIDIKLENDPAFAIRQTMAARRFDRVIESLAGERHPFDGAFEEWSRGRNL